MFTQEEINEFEQECLDLLESAESSLLELEKGGDFRFHFDAVFRTLHSIKGTAGMFERPTLQEVMHAAETRLAHSKDAGSLAKQETDFILETLDRARKLLRGETATYKAVPTLELDKEILIYLATTRDSLAPLRERLLVRLNNG